VGSDELGNLAVTVAAQGVARSVRVILRAGEQEAISETRSLLLSLGIVRDVNSISAAYVVARLLGIGVEGVVTDGTALFLRVTGAGFLELQVAGGQQCAHIGVDSVRRLTAASATLPG